MSSSLALLVPLGSALADDSIGTAPERAPLQASTDPTENFAGSEAPTGGERGTQAVTETGIGAGSDSGLTLSPDPSWKDRSTQWLLEEASRAYDQGLYEQAAALDQSAIARGEVNGHLYYNLGNAYQRMGETGRAIHAYRQAQLYLPRDADVSANLDYARRQLTTRSEAASPPEWKRFFFWYDRFSDFELLWIAISLNAAFWLLLALRRMRRGLRIGWALGLAGLGAALSLATGLARAWQYERTPDAVVLAPEVSVRSGTDVQSVALFVLHEGAEVSTRAVTETWVQVELAEGKRGWVERQFLGLVRP